MIRSRIVTAFGLLALLSAIVGFARMRARRAPSAARDGASPARESGAVAERGGLHHDDSFVALGSLDEARTMEHTAVIMQGGDGESIYLTIPTTYVACDDGTLRDLLAALDGLERRRLAAASISFELAPIGSGVFGGVEGGSIVDGMWLSPRLEALGVRELAADVLFGRRSYAETRDAFTALGA